MHARPKRFDRGLTVARAALVVAAVLLVGVLGYRQINRLTGEKVPVWIATGNLPKGAVVRAANLTLTRVSRPDGALVRRTDIEGRTLLFDKTSGSPFFPGDLEEPPPPPGVAQSIPAGRLLATVKVQSMDLPSLELKAGDRLDILQATTEGVRIVAHDAYMMGLMAAPAPTRAESGTVLGVDLSVPTARPTAPGGPALVLAVLPEDVFGLTAAEASGPKLKLVLHGAGEVQGNALIDLRPKARPAPRRGSRGFGDGG